MARTVAEYVAQEGRFRVLELALEWWGEARHLGVDLGDLDTALPDWDTILDVVIHVVLDPDRHPLRVDGAVVDFSLYLYGVIDEQ